jgi:4-hydroxybenzoate polyprenyltransferase
LKNISPVISKLADLTYLGRIGMSPLTVSVPILGVLTPSEPNIAQSPLVFFALGLVGLSAHFFGFALNDLIDQAVDSVHPKRQSHPLIAGRLSRREAWLFVLIQIPLALGLYIFALQGTLGGVILLGLSGGCSVAYNLWSKHGTVPRILPEVSLAVSIGLLCLAGASINSDQISTRSVLFATALALVLLLVNSVPSGLKDIKTDSESGARSFVLSTGSRMLDTDAIFLSRRLRIYCYTLQIAILVFLVVLTEIFSVPLPLRFLIIALGIYGGLHLRLILSVRSFQVLRKAMPLLNGYYDYFALALCVVPLMPLALQICYGLAVLALLAIPLRLGFQVWRNRYHY